MTQVTFGDPRLPDRFWCKVTVNPETGCWEWTRAKSTGGYGILRVGGRIGRNVPTHRMSYEALVGPIPDGLDMDHLCRVRHCCYPLHLEPVTRRENSLRGMSPQVITWRTDICKRGHSMADAYVRRDNGNRQCRTCRNEHSTALRRRRNPSYGLNLCKRGHDLDEHGQMRASGKRYCVTCNRQNAREAYVRKKASASVVPWG